VGVPMPDFFRKEIGFGSSADVAGLVAFLASDEAAGINGQVIGAGGDRIQMWSHPEPVLNLFHDGGWSAADLAAAKGKLLDAAQSVGEKFPALPEELRPVPTGA
jgi:NAD(P)-dependent dehydrogenase (short-subunit alcohol dehydrogenase family)